MWAAWFAAEHPFVLAYDSHQKRKPWEKEKWKITRIKSSSNLCTCTFGLTLEKWTKTNIYFQLLWEKLNCPKIMFRNSNLGLSRMLRSFALKSWCVAESRSLERLKWEFQYLKPRPSEFILAFRVTVVRQYHGNWKWLKKGQYLHLFF